MSTRPWPSFRIVGFRLSVKVFSSDRCTSTGIWTYCGGFESSASISFYCFNSYAIIAAFSFS